MLEVKKSAVKRLLTGKVVSDKMQKTITVLVERRVKHPLYGKVILRSRRYHVRDDEGIAKEGDLVEIHECAPIAKTVSWRLSRVLESSVVTV